MSTSLLHAVLREFGVSTTDFGGPADSRSGAGVHRVRTASGQPAFLKTTPAHLGPDALAAAHRELRFYRMPAPPCRTPDLLAWHDSPAGVALLLTSAGRTVSPREWSPAMWAALGDQLAFVHGIALPAWSRPDPLCDAMAGIDHAYWADVPELPAVLARTDELCAHMSALPDVFVHGDCHTGNVLFRDGRLALCDWQMAGAGRPSTDLAFLSVRATPSGVVVPPDLVNAYLSRRPCDADLLRRAMVADELATFLFLWPPFAAVNTPTGNARVARRVRSLAERWLYACRS